MIAFYEPSNNRPFHDENYYRWKKWCKDNAEKREKLMSRLNIAIINRDKSLERDIKKQIKKIDELRFK